MEFGSFAIFALVVIAVLAPLAAIGAWHLWRGGAVFARPEAQAATPPAPAPDFWLSLPLAIAGFDAEDRLIGASRAFREELGVRNIALDDVLRPGIAAQALFDAWAQRSGGRLGPLTAIATLPAHELTWPAGGGRSAHRLACIALHDAAGATYRLLVDPAIQGAAPVIPASEER